MQLDLEHVLKVFIECEAGSDKKNRYDDETLAYKSTDRVLRPYPYAYGFIVGTSGSDGECVDCFVITEDHLQAGTMVECEIAGLLEFDEDGEDDHKVIAYLPGQRLKIDQRLRTTLEQFIYGIFAKFPDMKVKVGDILPKQAALDHITRSTHQNPPDSRH